MKQSHRKTYEALKRQGHSPAKAIEIVLDAKRGNSHALNWCRIVLMSARWDRGDRGPRFTKQ